MDTFVWSITFATTVKPSTGFLAFKAEITNSLSISLASAKIHDRSSILEYHPASNTNYLRPTKMGVQNGSTPERSSPSQRRSTIRQRDKALSPHGHTVRFLYLMLKQFDTKHTNWQKVADGTGITTANSAKARYARFKKQIENHIDGDRIQAKREQKEEEQDEEMSGWSQDNTNSALNSPFTTPSRCNGAGINMRGVVKSEPGSTTFIKQESGQIRSQNSTENNDDEVMEVLPFFSADPNALKIKREQGLCYDFSDSLVKREKEIDEDGDDRSSFEILSSNYYGTTASNPCGYGFPLVATVSGQQPGSSSFAQQPTMPSYIQRSTVSSSSISGSGPSSSPNTSSPYQSLTPSPLGQKPNGSPQYPWCNRMTPPGATQGNNTSLSPQGGHPSNSSANSNGCNTGQSRKSSISEPVAIDD